MKNLTDTQLVLLSAASQRQNGSLLPLPDTLVDKGDEAMEADAMAKASDADIIHAFEELPDASGWDHPRSWMAGGNIQLARAFSTFAKAHPDRAVRIIAALDEDNGTRAAAYALDSLSEDAEPALVIGVMRDVVDRGFDGSEFRHSAAGALERLARRGAAIDDALFALLESWLTSNPPDAEADDDGETDGDGAGDLFGVDETAPSDAGNGGEEADPDDSESLLWGYGGFSIVPGGTYPVVEALVQMRLRQDEPDAALAALAGYLERNQSLKEWSSLAQFFPYLHRADPSRFKAFLEALVAKVPGPIGSKLMAQFLAHGRAQHPALVERHLADWRQARSRPARQSYGEIVALAALLNPDFAWGTPRLDAILCDAAAIDAHTGAALSAAQVFADGERRAAASELLVRLLDSGEAASGARSSISSGSSTNSHRTKAPLACSRRLPIGWSRRRGSMRPSSSSACRASCRITPCWWERSRNASPTNGGPSWAISRRRPRWRRRSSSTSPSRFTGWGRTLARSARRWSSS